MAIQKFQPKRIAPIQYLLRQLNSNAGQVVPGWGTTALMVVLMVALFLFLLLVLQLLNSTILLDGVAINWSSLSELPNSAAPASVADSSFTATGVGIVLGLLVFAACCVSFVIYGAITYPANQK